MTTLEELTDAARRDGNRREAIEAALSPCPFCGEDIHLTPTGGAEMGTVECGSCGAQGPESRGEAHRWQDRAGANRSAAARGWNDRGEPDGAKYGALVQLAEALALCRDALNEGDGPDARRSRAVSAADAALDAVRYL